jgi:serine/threonine protein kinase
MTVPNEAPELPPGARIADHFVVVRRLGGGGMGEVYLAENTNLPGVLRAIKILRRELTSERRFVDMLSDEAVRQARLVHDNIVMMLDLVQADGRCCLIADFVEGKTLEDLLAEKAGSGLPVDKVIGWMIDVLEGLDYAHRHAILHCDVKPANVIIDGHTGRARVTDFGISRDLSRSDGNDLVMGTLPYMSPEQIERPTAIDHRSDVFSAGVMCFELLTGQLPFPIPPKEQPVYPQLLRDAPDILTVRADIPERLALIVNTALQRAPDDRFQGCADFRAELQDFLRRQRLRKQLPAIAAAMLALAAATAFGVAKYHDWANAREIQRQAEERVRIQQDQQRVQEQRLVALNDTMSNALKSLHYLCREWGELQVKRGALDILKQMKDTERDQALFQSKLEAMQGNIARHATEVNSATDALSDFDGASVASEMDRRLTTDAGEQTFVRVLKEGFASRSKGQPHWDAERMKQACPTQSKQL